MAKPKRIESFDFKPGRVIAGKYVVERKLGGGYEGEAYKVTERKTGVTRAAKLFFPHRNHHDRAVRFYARKLERLSHCPIVVQYHSSETIQVKRQPVTCMISQFFEGELLSDFIMRHRGKRLHPFEAMHLVYAMACGLEQIHRLREYHGDLHEGNVLVLRQGIFFNVKLLDFYNQGPPSAARIREDAVELVRLLYESVGGRDRYSNQPDEIKRICRGMRRDLIEREFQTARHLREYLESFEWGV